ncbi:MAG: CvpA family protein [candidate division WOR-3 bacterium]
MAIDLALLLLFIVSALHGYGQGFIKGLNSCISPVLGVWLALRLCDGPARVLHCLLADHTLCRLGGFFLILACIWLGLKLVHRLLARLVGWVDVNELDRFLGGCLGLANAAVVAWVVLVAALSALPPAVRIIERSNGSVRLLALGELLGGARPNSVENIQDKEAPRSKPVDSSAMVDVFD